MAVNLLERMPKEWFNDQFSEIINSEITNPPYNKNFFDKAFFIKKRYGTELLKAKVWDTFQDIIEYRDINKTELLVSSMTSTKVIVYKLDLNTLVLTEILNQNKWNNARMFKVLGGWESVLTTWVATSGTINTLVKTSAAWVVNAYAWAYVYLSSWTGAGALCSILSNTADTLTVSNAGGWDPFDVAPAAWTNFTIYESLTNNIVIQTADSYYKYDWVSFVQIVPTQGNTPADATIRKSIFWYADTKWNVYYSDERDIFKFYDWSTATPRILRTGETDISRLYPFGDIMLVCTPNKMLLVKATLNSSTGNTIYSTQEILSNLWLFSSDAIHYNKWLYFVGSDKTFYSLSLSVTGAQYVGDPQDQGIVISNYLDRFVFGTDKLSIYSDSKNIYIFDTTGNSEEYVYSTKYKWWTKNEYAMNIAGKKILNNVFYFLGDWYIGFKSSTSYLDMGVDYTQKIEWIIGNDNIMTMKSWKYFVTLLWKTDYTQDGTLKAERQINNKKFSKEWDIFNTEYLSNIYDALQDTMWSSLMGSELMGGGNEDILEAISDIEIMKTPIDIAGYLCKLSLISAAWSWIMFWWWAWYENSMNPNIKSYSNTI